MLSAKQVEPGQSGQIEVTLKTAQAATLSKSVTVTTDDPNQRIVVLSLHAVVEPELKLSEQSISFGPVAKGEKVSKEVVITIHPKRSVTILGATATDQNLVPRLEPVPGSGGKKVKLVATLKAEAKEGFYFGTIILKTSSSNRPELRVSAVATIKAAGSS